MLGDWGRDFSFLPTVGVGFRANKDNDNDQIAEAKDEDRVGSSPTVRAGKTSWCSYQLIYDMLKLVFDTMLNH